jgi:hypothetical protein
VIGTFDSLPRRPEREIAGSTGCSRSTMRVGAFAHAIAWLRQRDHLSAMERTDFDRGFRIVLRRAIARTL